ncbi:ATP-binding component of cytochrome-related transport, Zn sensitive [Reinekea sp. MED297]|uniref:ATP-binding component of cytochrome-related transport, Zn sensitive n=2 Tax=Reinekea TaxID=230494 RepID=A4BGH0_9GAMM|nr:ATP-binding component of cytochrome-related transport, Zn sensitive [Reinekea sp. MED297] [Reinekea blandensis MED297]
MAALEPDISAGRWGLVALQLSRSLLLWWWFYRLSSWLGAVLQDGLDQPFPALTTVVVGAVLFGLRWLEARLRAHLGQRVQQAFYQRFFSELSHRRWALIRYKPVTAWQDVCFRHLPAMESYLLDYKTQQRLIAIVPLLVLGIVFPISWLAGLILLVTLPLLPLFMWLVGAGTASVQRKHMQVLNRLGGFFADRVAGVSTVRLLNQEADQLQRFDRRSRQHNERLADVLKVAFLSSSVLDFFATVSMALIAVLVGFSLLGEVPFGFYDTGATLSSGLFVLLLAPAFFAELKTLGRLYHVKAEATASADLWQHTLSWVEPEHDKSLVKPFNALTIQHAELFGFDDQYLLQLSELTLVAGDRVLLSGASGAGKTVLLDGLAGLRDFRHDTLTLNGQSVRSLSSLRDQVFYLDQHPPFVEGTVRDNLMQPHGYDDDCRRALTQVGLGDWLAQLDAGLDSVMAERTPLSGGQQQKFAVARLLLFDAPVVLLDEPLAHLSEPEQSDLLPLLVQATEGRTSVWISHHDLPSVGFNRHWWVDGERVMEVAE